jgi:hypothetical protein
MEQPKQPIDAYTSALAGVGATAREITNPTYYVRHPDGSYSIAEPQPMHEQIASQHNVYAQCDRKHSGSCCEDPYCYRIGRPEVVADDFQRDRIDEAMKHDAEQAKPRLGSAS